MVKHIIIAVASLLIALKNRDSKELIKRFNAGLEELKKDGTFKLIA